LATKNKFVTKEEEDTQRRLKGLGQNGRISMMLLKVHDYYGADNMNQSKQIKIMAIYGYSTFGCQVKHMCMKYEAIKQN
jgi:hypothetical protein